MSTTGGGAGVNVANVADISAPQKSVSTPFNANAVIQSYAQPYGYPTIAANTTTGTTDFPVQLYAPDARDKYYNVMGKVINDVRTKTGGAAIYAAGPQDVQYYADKADAQANGEFKSFLVKHMDLTKPESAAYWKSVAPEIFQERLNIVASQHELSKKLAQINIVGPQSIEDYAIIWGIQTGRIQAPPSGPLYRPETYKDWGTKKKTGLFSTFLWGTVDSDNQQIPGGDYNYRAAVGGYGQGFYPAQRWGEYQNNGLGMLPTA